MHYRSRIKSSCYQEYHKISDNLPMKKFIISALLCAPTIVFAQEQAFLVKGKIGKLTSPARAYISYKVDGKHVLDSVLLKNGSFEFKGKIAEPVFAKLMLDHTGLGQDKVGNNPDMTSLYVEKGTVILLAKDSLSKVEIKGSPLNDENKRYQKFLAAPQLVMTEINREYEVASPEMQKDPAFMKGLEMRFRKAAEDIKVLQKVFVKANPNSYFSLVALEESSSRKLNVEEAEPMFLSLAPALRNSKMGKAFEARITASRQK